jgi:AAA family ATP:ADP antiporter
MSFLICFNYYLLRTAKDTLVVTAPDSGAEAIPFLKVWAILPAAFLMTFLFTRLSNYLNRRKVFYAMLGFYIAYFLFFTICLYPYREQLHPNELADKLQAALPEGFKGLIAIFRNWTYTTFYIMAEMWSTMIMTILFWGFANDVTNVKEAKRFYGLFFTGTAMSGIAAGVVSSFLSDLTYSPSLPFGSSGWDQAIVLMNFIMIGTSVIAMGLFWWLNANNLGYTAESMQAQQDAPIKMGMRKNFAYLAKSPYLIWIAVLVVTFNIAINLVEVVWKDQVKHLYPSPSDYNSYMSGALFWMSIITTSITIFLSGNIIRRFGWTTSALIAPIVTLISGIFFFTCLLAPEGMLAGICLSFSTTPLALAVLFGTLQNCLLRGTKYSLVDATKELAFVPLNQESKLKGKAAIDGVGSRLGKSGGSLMHQCLLMLFGSVAGSVPIVSVLLLAALGGWIYAVRSVGRQFQQLTLEEPPQLPPTQEPIESTQAASLLS